MATQHEVPPYAPDDVRRFREAGWWRDDDTLAHYAARWAHEKPDAPALIAPGRTLTWAETWRAARRFANALRALGIGRSDVVGIQLPNHPEFLIAYFGVTMTGAILGTLHMPYRAGEMAPLMNHGRMRAMICGAAGAAYDAPAVMQGLRSQVPTLEHVIVLGEPAPAGCLSMAEMIENGPDGDPPDPPAPADHALLCFTSGTSAAPKGVLRDHRSLTANGRIIAPTLDIAADDAVLVAPPYTHVYGLCGFDAGLAVGASHLLLPAFTPEAFVERIGAARPTVIFTAPAHVATTLKAGLLDDRDLSSIRLVIVAGSVCPPEVAAELERRLPNGKVGQVFGMTEVVLTASTPPVLPAGIRHVSTGRATQGIEARIAGPDGDALPSGAEGELQLRGYSVMPGYLANAQADRDSFAADGWFRTGDLATIDGDGNWVITGRVKDVINRGSVKINPTDVENVLSAHDKVIQAAIVPMFDELLGEKGCLFVTLVPGASLTFVEMTAHLAANGVAKMRWPERLEIIDEMPVTPTRKIVKGELAKRL